MIALWTILVVFCLIVFRQYLKVRPDRKFKWGAWGRVKLVLRAVWSFTAFLLCAPTLLTAPIWALVWVLTGWNIIDFWIKQIETE